MDFLPPAQNTTERAQIPGKDGGCVQKVPVFNSGLDPAPQAEPSPVCPSAQGRWIRRPCRISAVRYGLLGGLASGDPLAGLLSAVQAVVRGGR